GQTFELSRDKIIFGRSKQQVLRLRHLHDYRSEFFRQTALRRDDAFHCSSLLRTDVEIGPGDPAEQISERCDIARLLLRETVELLYDLSDCLCFGGMRGLVKVSGQP